MLNVSKVSTNLHTFVTNTLDNTYSDAHSIFFLIILNHFETLAPPTQMTRLHVDPLQQAQSPAVFQYAISVRL